MGKGVREWGWGKDRGKVGKGVCIGGGCKHLGVEKGGSQRDEAAFSELLQYCSPCPTSDRAQDVEWRGRIRT